MIRIPIPRIVPYRMIAILVPFAVVFIQMGIMYVTLPYGQFVTVVGLMVAYILPPAGKETVIPLGIALGIPWGYMALAIAMVDIETGLFMALNFDLAYQIPVLGKILTNFTEKTKIYLKNHRWFAELSFLGIILMVMVPVLGSGGIRGSIAGYLLGIGTRRIFLAVLVGALIGCFGIAFGSDAIIHLLCSNGTFRDIFGVLICNR
jgi:uncharacterized membrane protein